GGGWGIGRTVVMRAWDATEDWWAVWLGLLVVALALPAAAGFDLLGWVAAAQVWIDPAKAIGTASRAYAGLPGLVSLVLTYLLVAGPVGLGAWGHGVDPPRVLTGFPVLYLARFLFWLARPHRLISHPPPH